MSTVEETPGELASPRRAVELLGHAQQCLEFLSNNCRRVYQRELADELAKIAGLIGTAEEIYAKAYGELVTSYVRAADQSSRTLLEGMLAAMTLRDQQPPAKDEC